MSQTITQDSLNVFKIKETGIITKKPSFLHLIDEKYGYKINQNQQNHQKLRNTVKSLPKIPENMVPDTRALEKAMKKKMSIK